MLLTVGAGAVGGALVVLIKLAFGDVQSVHAGVMIWSLIFLLVGEGVALQGLMQRRWGVGLISGGVVATLGFLAMRYASPAIMAVICTQTVCIVPVTS
jgi:hypothetical protein